MTYQLVGRILILAAVMAIAGCSATDAVDDDSVYTYPTWPLMGQVCWRSSILIVVGALLYVVGALLGNNNKSTALIKLPAEEPRQGEEPKTETEFSSINATRNPGPLLETAPTFKGKSIPAWLTAAAVLVWILVLFWSLVSCVKITLHTFDKVSVSDSGFVSDEWNVYRLERTQFDFDDIQAIQTRQLKSFPKGGPRVHQYADFTFKSGRKQTIYVGLVLQDGWPEIARKAAAKGVRIVDAENKK